MSEISIGQKIDVLMAMYEAGMLYECPSTFDWIDKNGSDPKLVRRHKNFKALDVMREIVEL